MNPNTFHATQPEHRTVRIPGSDDHDGHHLITVTLSWVCPVCGAARGRVFPTVSYDGSRRLTCDGWTNPCGHVDFYADVRAEAASLLAAGSAQVRQPNPTSL